MIKIKKEELLKNSPDYEEYSENVCTLTIEEMREAGLLTCGGCCSKKNKGFSGECSKKSKGCACGK